MKYKIIRNIFFGVFTVFYQAPVLSLSFDEWVPDSKGILDKIQFDEWASDSKIILDKINYESSLLNWRIRPRLGFNQIFSDNIRLSNVNQKSALVTENSSGVTISAQSGLTTFDLDYNLQSIYNAQGDSGIDFYSQLQMDTLYEPIRNRLYVESSATVSQQNTSNRQIVSDNISGDRNSTTISTFELSPYWTPHFNGYADGEFRLTYDRVSSSRNDTQLSDTNAFSQNISLTSGRYFSIVSWSLLFNNSIRSNSESDDISFQNSEFEVRYALAKDYSVFARVGQSNNSFSSNSETNENGMFYTLGGQWQPSRYFRVEAGYGNNRFITVELNPFDRLNWITTYSDNDIGLNTGGRWDSQLSYRTRRSNWSLSYSEATLTTQDLLLDQQIFGSSTTGNSLRGERESVVRNSRLPTLTDEVFVEKSAEISVSFRTGKSDFSAEVFKTFRTFEETQNDEEVLGFNTNWNWQFSRKMSTNLSFGWEKTESDALSNTFLDKRIDFSAEITRNIMSRLNGSIEYRYIDQSSDSDVNNYSENRLTANLSYQF